MIEVGSDFSGVGALIQALRELNISFDEKFACDMDKYARQSYIINYGTKKDKKILEHPDYVFVADVFHRLFVETKLVQPKKIDIDRAYKICERVARMFSFYYPWNVYNRDIPNKPLGLYMTSPPCQGFSIAGKREGSVLFLNSHEFIKKNGPRFFIFENVKGLLSHDRPKTRPKGYGRTFNQWIQYLGGKSVNGQPTLFPHDESVPYHIYHAVLNATDYGVPQNRERVFIVGIRDDKDNDFNWPKPFPLELRLKDVLETDVDEKYYLSDKMIKGLTNKNSQDNGFTFNPKNNYSIGNCVTARCFKMGADDNYLKVIKHERTLEAKQKRSKSLEESGKDTGSFADRQMIAVEQDYSDTVLANPNPKKEGLIIMGAIRGRNPENLLSREVGLPTELRLELNMNGTSNALTTVQKDNVVCELRKDEGIRYFKDNICGTIRTIDAGGDKHIIEHNNLFNTEKNIIFNGNKTIEDEKRNTIEILRVLCKEIGTKKVEAWGLRILETVREKEILQQRLYEESIQGKTEEKTIGINDKIQSSKGTTVIATIIMRSLPKEKWERCTPQRRKPIKQLIRKLNEGVQKLSFENSQTEINMQSRKLQYKNERLRLLREALSKIQKIWQSINGETQPIQQDYRIRRLTPREAFRLMDFPDSFKIKVSDTQAYKQAGNSICVGVLAAIISKIKF